MVRQIKKILNKMFGRLQLTCLVLLLQLAWFALLVLRLNEYYEYFAVTFTIASILMALFVIYRDDNPAYKLGWIMLISLVPIFGALMYGFFGNKRPSRRIRVKVNPVQERHRRDLVQKYQMEEINDSRLMRTIN